MTNVVGWPCSGIGSVRDSSVPRLGRLIAPGVESLTVVPGTRLGPYVIEAPLGAGGMGEVWKARDTRPNRFVAIKFATEQFSQRFEREGRAVAALNHPHICILHDVGRNYLVMERVGGHALAGPLPLDRALLFATQILSALDAAHRKGITHRDLKPANILVKIGRASCRER